MSVSADLERCRIAGEAEGEAQKNPYIVVDRLIALYDMFRPSERPEADRVFAQWLTSREGSIWHLGLIMINRLRLLGAIPDLIQLADRFRASEQPGSRQWAETVDRIVSELISASEEVPRRDSERK